MKKIIIIVLIILLTSISIILMKSSENTEVLKENKINVEEYQNESYLKNIVSYKIINNEIENNEKLVANVGNEKDIDSLINLLNESEKSNTYSYENENYKFYIIAYLFDNSAVKIEGNKNEIRVSSLDDENSYEYYKLNLEDDIQSYFLRKFEKNVRLVNYFLIKENGKYGVIDSYKNIVILPEYDYIKIINNNIDLFICTKENKTQILDSNKNLYFPNVGEKISEIIISDIEEVIFNDILKYHHNEKYGLINLKGEKITGLEYSDIYSLGYLKNYIILEKEDVKKQLVKVDLNNIEVLAEFDEIGIRINEEGTEYIIYGKNVNEEEQIIHIEKMQNEYISNFPEILNEVYTRRYEDGLYFYEEFVPEISDQNLEEEKIN